MAEKMIRTQLKTWKINTSYDNILGKGAYGIVYKAFDDKGNKVAAKTIDGKLHSRILSQNFDKLLELDHPNVVRFLDIHQEETTVFMFMTLCLFDLNKLFRKNKIIFQDKLDIMEQISEGLVYLHSKDVIHRDIKPDNILVSSVSPILVKLTDFDVSKVLDPEVETSAMSSNVGTLMFKAPEFFKRTDRHKIKYHRHVDTFAAGLTFLGILQYEEGDRIVPHIETAKEPSELHVPVGMLIVERIKYNVPVLDIVVVDLPFKSHYEETRTIKQLIKNMTSVNPEDRLSLEQVLFTIQTELKGAAAAPAVSHAFTVQTELEEAKSSVSKALSYTNKTKEPQLILKKMFTHQTTPNTSTAKVNSNGDFIVRGKREERLKMPASHKHFERKYIRLLDRVTGTEIRDLISHCEHESCYVGELPGNPDYIIESCFECNVIRTFNFNYPFLRHAMRGYKSDIMCPGPDGSILVLGKNSIAKLEWVTEKEQLVRRIHYNLQTNGQALTMCYIENYDILAFILKSGIIKGIQLSDLSSVWEFEEEVHGKKVSPNTMCCDDNGQIYVGDDTNNLLFLLSGMTGKLLQVLLQGKEELPGIWRVCWTRTQPQLIISDGYARTINCYSALESSNGRT